MLLICVCIAVLRSNRSELKVDGVCWCYDGCWCCVADVALGLTSAAMYKRCVCRAATPCQAWHCRRLSRRWRIYSSKIGWCSSSHNSSMHRLLTYFSVLLP